MCTVRHWIFLLYIYIHISYLGKRTLYILAHWEEANLLVLHVCPQRINYCISILNESSVYHNNVNITLHHYRIYIEIHVCLTIKVFKNMHSIVYISLWVYIFNKVWICIMDSLLKTVQRKLGIHYSTLMVVDKIYQSLILV